MSEQVTAKELGGLIEAEKAGIAMGWLQQCDYVGFGRCVRSSGHPLPHATDPSVREAAEVLIERAEKMP